MENIEELQKRIAWLESRLDQSESELAHLNQLLVDCGFPEGLKTLKLTIEDLLGDAGQTFRFPSSDENPPQTMDPFA